MTETHQATNGYRRITRKNPPVKVRLFGFVAVIICGSILLAWITRNTWKQLDHFQKEHAAVQSESFYLGVSFKSGVRGLNDKMLKFGLSRDPVLQNEFFREAAEWQEWIQTHRAHLQELSNLKLLRSLEFSLQLSLLHQSELAYQKFLKNATAFFERSQTPGDAVSFELVYKQAQEASSELFLICDDLVKAEREGFSEFLAETQGTLTNHQNLLKLTSALILGLAAALAVLVYRGMIAPLRVGLSESKSIIERQEKLASLGVLASGVAHEIRNPLTAIKIRLFSLKRLIRNGAGSEEVTVISNEINRLERIVKDFLKFARPSEPEFTKIPAGQILHEVQELLGGQLDRAGIHLRIESEQTACVRADTQQMKQVLINLVQNSAETVGRNGTITLGLRRGIAELDGQPQPVAILAVADNGKGIPPEVELRLFDPFFTTKEGGTGLGLAIAARIVEKHGGLLRYETAVKRGTTFEVVLPEFETNATKYIAHRG